VSRELRRNALPSGRYSPLHAAGAYVQRGGREAVIEKDTRSAAKRNVNAILRRTIAGKPML
jgi:hypothetical protein